MTPNEFKEAYPQYAHLEADQLWDAMTLVMMKKESEEKKMLQKLFPIHDELKSKKIHHVFILVGNDQCHVFGKIDKGQLAYTIIDILKSDEILLKIVSNNFL